MHRMASTFESALAPRRWVAWLFVLAIFNIFSSIATAGCGSATRHMIWRNSNNAELIRMDCSVFIPSSDSKWQSHGMSIGRADTEIQGDRPLCIFRCKDERQVAIPLAPAGVESPQPPVCLLASHRFTSEDLSLAQSFIDLSNLYLNASLHSLDRPPRSNCG